jgi:hypothetical protein
MELVPATLLNLFWHAVEAARAHHAALTALDTAHDGRQQTTMPGQPGPSHAEAIHA